MSLLGVDIGTTGCKAIVFSLEGRILSSAYREYPLIHPQPGWAELDSDVVWKACTETIKEAAGLVSGGDRIRALSVSVQGEAVTPLDEAGNALDHSIVTFDNRTGPQARFWEERLGKGKVFEITGMPLHSMYTINKIMWWRENRPEVWKRARKFLCYEELFFYRLGLPPVIDYSLASRTMAFDIHRKSWSDEILESCDISQELLGLVQPSGSVVGEIPRGVAAELGLPEGVLAVAGGHDQPCGAVGAGIIRPGIAMDATGTVECIAPALDRPVLDDNMLKYNYPCYCHVVGDMYVTLAFNFTGGSLLRWYRDTFGQDQIEKARKTGRDVYDLLISEASGEPTELLVLPHFAGTGTPWLDPHAVGAIVGLRLSTCRGEFLRGLLEGVTYEMKLNLELLSEAGVEVSELRAIGGGARSDFWLQLKSDVFGRRVVALDVSEAASLGAAILAGVGSGEYRNVQEGVEATLRPKKTFEPEPRKMEHYNRMYKTYRDLYRTIKELEFS